MRSEVGRPMGPVIEGLGRAEVAGEVEVRGARERGDAGAEHGSDLHAEAADAAAPAAHQEAFARLQPGLVAQGRHGGGAAREHRDRVGVGEVLGGRRDLVRADRDVLGGAAERAAQHAPHPAARGDVLDRSARLDHLADEVDAQALREPAPGHQAHLARAARELAPVDADRADADEDLVALDLRHRHRPHVEDVGTAVAVVEGCAHGAQGCSVRSGGEGVKASSAWRCGWRNPTRLPAPGSETDACPLRRTSRLHPR
ncbi:hypothetical protein FHU35_14335 [Saccharopolyspora dendranthemae]|uniref:Uncharacterized protein n=1 Tax=Saccharopolyspora dendranthemae TaxID=1181886 RepID=A0A561U3X1_9PSEU|nr:hypothetical protein FHU35_14335 [Saccharopolyspora dendranthemae]